MMAQVCIEKLLPILPSFSFSVGHGNLISGGGALLELLERDITRIYDVLPSPRSNSLDSRDRVEEVESARFRVRTRSAHREIGYNSFVISSQGSGLARVWCRIHCSVVGVWWWCRLGMVYFAPQLHHTVPRESKHLGPSVVCVVRVWLRCGTTLPAVVMCSVVGVWSVLHHTCTTHPPEDHHTTLLSAVPVPLLPSL